MRPRRTQRGVAGYKALLPVWTDLMVKRFKCGHEKTPWNTYACVVDGRDYGRCKKCQDARQKRGIN